MLERIRVEDNALIVDGDKIQLTEILAVRVEKQALSTLVWESLIITVVCATVFWLLPVFKTQGMATLCLSTLLFIAVVVISLMVLKRFALKIKCRHSQARRPHWVTLAKSNKLTDYLHFQDLRHTLMQRLMR